MKKNLLLSCFTICVFSAPAADWDLFPFNQKSFYQFRNSFQVDVVHEILLDSVFISGNSAISFFLRKYQGLAHGNCYDQLIDFNPNPQVYGDDVEMDSLIQSNDTVIFPGYHKILYFIPGASAGQMWSSHDSLGSSGFTDLHITCSSVQVETFLGITDSVKTFSFSGYNGNVHFASAFDTLSFKLSKHYGLTQYVPFGKIRDHYLSYQTYHNLLGVQSGAISTGFVAPSYLRFFPYHPGDILNWQYVGACSTCIPPTIIYSRDSITGVSSDPDTFSYNYWRWSVQDTFPVHLDTNMITKYAVSVLVNIFESPTNWISIAADIYGIGTAFISSRLEIYNSHTYNLRVAGNDTVISRSYNLLGLTVDTLNCNVYDVPDATYTLDANTEQGVIKTCYDSWGPMCTYLIGSIILGDTIGFTELAVAVPEIAAMPGFVISPNPATNTFTVLFSAPVKNSELEIYNILGKQIYFNRALGCGLLTVDCGLFPSGIYFVKIESENGNSVQKLIIE